MAIDTNPVTGTPTSINQDLSGAVSRDGVNYKGRYANATGYSDAFNQRIEQLGGSHSDSDGARRIVIQRLDDAGDQFKTLFKNNVGRDPTAEQISKFFSEAGGQAILDTSTEKGQGLRNLTAQYIGDTFQNEAQDIAQQKTSELSGKYGSLADQYLEMGKKSLGNLSDELQSYSTSLFDKLRPQLNLAAQAGGYADSGGQTLQEQGALTDLANQGRGVLADKAYEVENNANNIRYGGMAAPVSMASEFAANAPYAVANLGAGGLGFNNSEYAANQNYLRQLGLLSAQGKMMQDQQPSFGRTLSQTFASGLGKGFSNFFDPTTYFSAAKTAAPVAAA